MVNVGITLAFLSVVQNVFTVTGSSNPKRVAYEMDEIGAVGIRKLGTVIKVIEDIALTSCSEFCVDKTDCIAFNYDIVLRTCETLATVASVSGSEIKSENNLFVTNLTWTEGLERGRPCSSKPCNGIERCIDLEPSGHVCAINECNYPTVREGMKLFDKIITTIGTTTRYECENYLKESYRFSPMITCQSDGLWNDVTFHCKCNNPPPKEGMKLSKKIKTEIGATARYECQSYLTESYRFSPMIMCKSDGIWTDVIFKCRCGEPPPMYRAQIVGTERRTGATVQYTCNTAYYKPSGYSFSTCLSSGQWSSTNFQCLDGWTCSSAIICVGINLIYTRGNNWATPGCGTCWCCQNYKPETFIL